jgi:hypothetical protein
MSISDPRKTAAPIALSGLLSAIGALGLVITNIFYALALADSPAAVQPLDLGGAMSGAITSAFMLKAAGGVGIIGDVIWATAALLMAQEFGRRGWSVAAAGWNALVLAIILFIFVDGMTGFVLPQLAIAHNVSAFEGFRRFWDVLFLLCALCFGAATIVIVLGDLAHPGRILNRVQVYAMIAVGAVGSISAAEGLAAVLAGGLPFYAIAGTSIGVGAAFYIPFSIQIAHAGRAGRI